MTLDEAIKYNEEKAKELSNKAYEQWGMTMTEEQAYACHECAREHEQLAKWLKELRKMKKCRECPLVKEECKLCGFKEAENE